MAGKKIFTVTDLGGGDGGKGGVVQKIVAQKNAHTVLKVGGAQGCHGVRTSRGESFNFSQFGCGTFEGARTHITELMVIEPYRLLEEAYKLRYEWRIENIFSYLTVDGNALCVTPFHTVASRLRELARGKNPKGTVGVGIGEAVRDKEKYPDLAIYAKDLLLPNLSEKIEAVKINKAKELAEIIARIPEFSKEDQIIAQEQLNLFNAENFVKRIVQEFNEMGRLVKVVDRDYLRKNVLGLDGTVVVESSHGVLTDKYYGFHPHTTALRTLPQFTLRLLSDCGYDGEIVKLGVTRAYQIRHGAGPMVTESYDMIEQLLPGSNKDENRWQGKVRVGPIDFVALRYAVEVCGGPDFFDGLAVTWFDQIQTIGRLNVCNDYSGATDTNFFTPTGEVKVRRGNDQEQLGYQEKLGKILNTCRPNVTSYDLSPNCDWGEATKLCKSVFEERLNIPLKMISFGSAEDKKVCL